MHAVAAGWLTGTGPSGANRRLLGLLQAMPDLLRRGERITLLHADDHRPDLPAEIECLSVAIRAAPPLRRWLGQRRVLPRVLHDLGATVFEQGFLPVNGRLPCPLSLTVHDLRDVGTFARRPRWLARRGIAHALRCAAAVTVPSRFTQSVLEREFTGCHPEIVAVIGNGVDDRFLATPLAETVPLPKPEGPYFLHVGHLEPRKNLGMLLEAWRRLGDTAPRLVLAGADAGSGAALRQIASDRVTFLGPVEEERLLELYAGCVSLLFPSLYEGYGLPALEALALGKPVLVSDEGALPEVVGGVGIVLPANDPDAWADAVRYVDGDKGAENRRAHARARTWRHAAAATLQLWRRLGS